MPVGSREAVSSFTYPLPYRTLSEALLAAPPEKTFVTMWNSEEEIESLTFGEFITIALAQGDLIRAGGLQPGDTVILVMPQGIPLMTAFAGVMLAGGIPAILAYPNFKVEPAKYRFGLQGVSANLRARIVLLDEAFPEDLMGHVAMGGDSRVVRLPSHTNAIPAAPATVPSHPQDVAFIQHSAGTTGLQKGVALSHASVLRQLNHLGAALGLQADDRIYSWLPLYHDMGLIGCFMLPMVFHLPVVMQSPTEWVIQPRTMLQLITEYRCTRAWIPNFTLQFLARRVAPEERAEYDLASLRAMINCSEPVRARSMDEFQAAFESCGLRPEALQSSYALAETVFAVTQSGTPEEPLPRRVWVDAEAFASKRLAVPVAPTAGGAICFVSSGRCLPGSRVRIASPTGEELPEGGVGEILIQSDSLFDGYYNRPDLTAKALKDGWYWSGDLGFYLDEELYVIGRKKDLIIVAGKNIYPQDVEEIVYSHPSIYEGRAIAFGHFNSDLGTEDILIVAEVRNEQDLENPLPIERELRSRIVAELGVAARGIYLKPPRWIVKSTAGKPARSTTREKLFAEHPELRPRTLQEEPTGGWSKPTVD